MAAAVGHAWDAFWDAKHWWPPGVNWTTLRDATTADTRYPLFEDMYKPMYYSFFFIAIRIVFEWSVARPLGVWLGIANTTSELPNIFKRVYYECRARCWPSANPNVVNGVPRKRTQSGRFRPLRIHKSTLDKFAESSWRFAFYLFVFVYGVIVLWDKVWLWDQIQCWYGYPFQAVTDDIYWYYMMESSFYWSLFISQFVDVHRKDFWMNFVHHVATISLLWLSWADNFARIGTLVLVLHDSADWIMELGKMFRYANYHKTCNTIAIIFTFTWFGTRCGILPVKILYSTLIEAPTLIVWFRVYYIFNGLLLTLQVLHILWSLMLLRIIIGTIRSGVTDDVRSDDEDDDDDDDSAEDVGGEAKASKAAKAKKQR